MWGWDCVVNKGVYHTIVNSPTPPTAPRRHTLHPFLSSPPHNLTTTFSPPYNLTTLSPPHNLTTPSPPQKPYYSLLTPQPYYLPTPTPSPLLSLHSVPVWVATPRVFLSADAGKGNVIVWYISTSVIFWCTCT